MKSLLDFPRREFATFAKARHFLVDAIFASTNPPRSKQPSCLDLTVYHFSQHLYPHQQLHCNVNLQLVVPPTKSL